MKNLYFLLVCIILCACGTTPISSSSSTSASVEPELNGKSLTENAKQQINSMTEEYYFGVTNSGSERRAWLVKLGAKGGVLYMPPGNLRIRHPSISGAGNVSFETEPGLGGVSYRFAGRFEQEKILGEFRTSSAEPNVGSSTGVAVTLERMPITTARNALSGFYSNVQFVEEAGDLVGQEVILISAGNQLVGVFTSYESEIIPFSFYPKQVGKKVEFEIITASGTEQFKGFISPKKIQIRRTDADADPKSEPMILPRKKGLDDFLMSLK